MHFFFLLEPTYNIIYMIRYAPRLASIRAQVANIIPSI